MSEPSSKTCEGKRFVFYRLDGLVEIVGILSADNEVKPHFDVVMDTGRRMRGSFVKITPRTVVYREVEALV